MKMTTKTTEATRSGMVELVPGFRAPARSEALFAPDTDGDIVEFEVRLVIAYDGDRFHVEELCCHRVEGGPAVTGEAIRALPVARLMGEAAVAHVFNVEPTGAADRSVRMTPLGAFGPGDVTDGPTDEALRKVAVVYQLHHACGLPPTRAVEIIFELPRSTAGRWVGMARERGLLGPTTPGRASG